MGALLAQWGRGLINDVYCQIGLVMLIGLSAKNGILIVEFAEQLRARGLSIADAAVEAARIRLRPILMTSLAFILGVMPLVVASGAGREARHSVGTAVAGGMLASTFLNLLFIPVLYVVVKSIGAKRGQAWKGRCAGPGGAGLLAVVGALRRVCAMLHRRGGRDGASVPRRGRGAQTPAPAERVTFDEAIRRAVEKNPSAAIAAAGILRAEGLLAGRALRDASADQRQRHDDDAEHGRGVSGLDRHAAQSADRQPRRPHAALRAGALGADGAGGRREAGRAGQRRGGPPADVAGDRRRLPDDHRAAPRRRRQRPRARRRQGAFRLRARAARARGRAAG